MARFGLSQFLWLWLAALAPVAAAPVVEFVDPVRAVEVGESFGLAMRFSNLGDATGSALRSYEFALAFDPTRVVAVSIAFGDPAPGVGNQLDPGGLGTIQTDGVSGAAWFVGEASLSLVDDLVGLQLDEFVLAVVTFEALATGTSEIGIVPISMDFVGGDPGAVLLGPNAHISVAEPDPGVLMLVGLAGLLVMRQSRASASRQRAGRHRHAGPAG